MPKEIYPWNDTRNVNAQVQQELVKVKAYEGSPKPVVQAN
jgi:hypothetical protein